MVEYDDALGAALAFDQRFHLRIVDPPDLILVIEVLNFGIVAHEAKAVALQQKIFRMGTAVVNGYAARIGRAAWRVSVPPGPATMVKTSLPSSIM